MEWEEVGRVERGRWSEKGEVECIGMHSNGRRRVDWEGEVNENHAGRSIKAKHRTLKEEKQAAQCKADLQ